MFCGAQSAATPADVKPRIEILIEAPSVKSSNARRAVSLRARFADPLVCNDLLFLKRGKESEDGEKRKRVTAWSPIGRDMRGHEEAQRRTAKHVAHRYPTRSRKWDSVLDNTGWHGPSNTAPFR